VVVIASASTLEIRFTYISSIMVEDELVDGGSTDVETWDSIERGSIEACAETS